MNSNLVQPKSLSGVMELLPSEQILFDDMKQKIENTFKSYGFLPIDTPSIERADVLLAKAGGETEKQIYKFTKGDNDICLRFDLTVPLSKYVAANLNNLEFPFKRYQIGKSYRGEKAQKGRYREFYQCDIDTIGKDNLSLKNDAEYPAIIYDIFKKLNVGDFVIYINNRKIVNGFFDSLGLVENKQEVMRLLDKYYKIGEENVVLTLREDYKLPENTISKILQFINLSGTNDQKLQQLNQLGIENQDFATGVFELEEVIKYIRMQGVPDANFEINPCIVRGLDYYTGTVYETYLRDYPNIGCVCGGGRYDNLASYYTDAKLPGVGVSIGLTRLFYQLNEQHLIKLNKTSVSDVLILPMDEMAIEKSYKIANLLRNNGLNCQLYVEDKKFKNKMSYADKLAIPYIAIIGEDEIKNGCVTIKNMFEHTQDAVLDDDLVNYINLQLNAK